MEPFNLRHLRAFWQVAESGSISAASEEVYLSQPAITQALAKLERTLGPRLFVRKSTGMFLTEAGRIMYRRVDRALSILADGARLAARNAGRRKNGGFQSFDRLLTTVQLRAFLTLAETGNYSWAARQLGVSPPSIHRAINDLERISGFALFKKTAQGFKPTELGDAFRRHVLLAFAELRQGLEEIDLALGSDTAVITVGSLPLARSFILPTAINRLTAIRRDLRIVIRDGAYTDLLTALRYGEIDILIGALRSPLPADDVEQEALYTDQLSIAARADHPLAGRNDLDASRLTQFPWVTPSPSIPTREHFEALFAAAGLEAPARLVETSSLILIRGLLVGSDRLTIISRHQISSELESGVLTTINYPLDGSERQIGITTRRGFSPTPSQSAFVQMLRDVCAEQQRATIR